jgi:hypothetical protein
LHLHEHGFRRTHTTPLPMKSIRERPSSACWAG